MLYKILIPFSLIGLVGCNFKPLYQKKNHFQFQKDLFSLQVTGSNEEAYNTYKFKQELLPLLYQIDFPKKQKYNIKISVTEYFGDIGYAPDASPIRSQGRMVAYLKIFQPNNLTPIYSNTLDSVSSYTLNEREEFANLNAKNATRERLIINLAEEVAREISFVVKNKI